MVVRRSAVRMWLIAIGSIPLLMISVDVLTNRRITDWLRDIIFTPSDPQIYEPRDVIFAWAILLFSGLAVLWGLKELFAPTRVIEGHDDGLAVKLRGPFRPHDMIRWSDVVDVQPGTVEDDGDTLPVLQIKLLLGEGLPEHPWGARWVGDRTLAVLAQDWSKSPEQVADDITEYAIEAARRQTRERMGRHLRGGESEEEE